MHLKTYQRDENKIQRTLKANRRISRRKDNRRTHTHTQMKETNENHNVQKENHCACHVTLPAWKISLIFTYDHVHKAKFFRFGSIVFGWSAHMNIVLEKRHLWLEQKKWAFFTVEEQWVNGDRKRGRGGSPSNYLMSIIVGSYQNKAALRKNGLNVEMHFHRGKKSKNLAKKQKRDRTMKQKWTHCVKWAIAIAQLSDAIT